MKKELTCARLRELLDYCPETGLFIRRVRVSNRVAGETVPGCFRKGALVLRVDDRLYSTHRLAWLHVTGAFPLTGLDHKDGDFRNNRLSNLRLANQSENMQNQRRPHKNTTSGLLGASWDARRQKWSARITVGDRYLYLGRFETPELAHAAYLKAKAEYHPFQMLVDKAA